MQLCNGVSVLWVLCFVYVYFVLLTTSRSCVHALKPNGPALDFSHYTLVTPKTHHAKTKREITTTKNDAGLHERKVHVTLDVDGEELILDLMLNEELVSGNHQLHYQKDGQNVRHRPTKEELDICQYKGVVRGRADSWAAVSTCGGLRGVVFDGVSLKYIEPNEPNLTSAHYVYDHDHLVQEKRCGYIGGVTNNTDYDPHYMQEYLKDKEMRRSRIMRHKRETEAPEIRGPFNANKNSRYVELVLVGDHGEYEAHGGDLNTMHRQMKDIANIINTMYTPLNIFIALVGVVIWTERDEIILLENGDDTLNNFLDYRRKVLIPSLPNDNAQLITRQKFKDGVVGKALKGPICTFEFSGGLATNHSEVIGLIAATIAHEMGHNFGMEHDIEGECECPDEKCIMHPSSTSIMPMHWSSCSLKSLALSFDRGMDYCLRNKPPRLFNSPTCGNGFVELGEQCDCGGDPRDCARCCDVTTCQLRSNATCATGACCDMQRCRPKSAGTVCRAADRECDLPEFCTGASEYCPRDVYKMDAVPCKGGLAYCVQGSCRTHSDQCKLLWGLTGNMSHTECYAFNRLGEDSGNCGYDRVGKRYSKCAPRDVLCGLLHCKHLNEHLEFGMDRASTQGQRFITDRDKIAACRTALIDLGVGQTDPGMVPDGAKCGEHMMCMNQKCVSADSVLANMRIKDGSVCPSNCSGNGVCNSEGHCHCNEGFSPPLCLLPGPGGSVDSGPATDPTVQRNFMITMYVIFLGIIPSVVIVMFLYYYSKHNVIWFKKSKKSLQSPKKSSLQRRISRGASKFAANFQSASQSQSNPQSVNVHTLSSPDDMSSSLLRNDDTSPAGNLNPTVNFFGNFRGFSLTPLEKEAEAAAKAIADANKSAKITPVHRTPSNAQNVQGSAKAVLRSAPPLPVVPMNVKNQSPKTSPSVKRSNSSVQNKIKAFINTEKTENVTTAGPPVRPVISSPILEASTCTAKELISPLQGSKTLGPVRAAPTIPIASPDLPKRPLSMHSANNVLDKPLPEEPKKVKEGMSLNRIASFLKSEKPRNVVERSNSLPKNPNHQIKIPKSVDKAALRNLQISNPILQKDIDLPVNTVPVVSDSEDSDDPRAFVNRTQSMRGPISQKPIIQSFGSMRQAPGVPRPVSVVGRPTAPPPPLPEQNAEISHQIPIYQNKSTDYVDCIEEKQAPLANIDEECGDNIYAIIEESPVKHSKPIPGVTQPIKTTAQPPPDGYNVPKAITSGSTESVGLLGEIVSEIQNRNLESIYSASTLARKKKEREKENSKRDSTYMNSEYKTPESVYSNSGAKSIASTTSSGYLHPSAVNVPTYLNKKNEESPRSDDSKTPPSPTMKVNSKIPTFGRQVTPPVLKNTSTFKSVPQSPKITPKAISSKPISINSPDVVSSCAVVETKNTKPPDVINNNKSGKDTPKVTVKPSITNKINDNVKPPFKPTPIVDKKTVNKAPLKQLTSSTKTQLDNKPVLNRVNSKVDSNVKAIADNLNKNKPKIVPKPPTIGNSKTDNSSKPNAAKLAVKPSNVASLQQKFENRKSVGRDLTSAK